MSLMPASMDDEAMKPELGYVTLVSGEGYEFVLDRRAAEVSNLIKSMISGTQNIGISMQRFTFDDVSAPVMELICQYLAERHRTGTSMSEFAPLRGLDPDRNPGDKDIALELLLAANYFDC
eukprot:TRINITY_DN21521_c0_g1_i1.p1 TRINITY_DN21521_c0_g1~~TRINITY_DN21521_c0_g1_i1.p1  ORF type:complete len:121 (+),score=41.65 TRINITY_DN21521_c0_g1_i1:51-413(+)